MSIRPGSKVMSPRSICLAASAPAGSLPSRPTSTMRSFAISTAASLISLPLRTSSMRSARINRVSALAWPAASANSSAVAASWALRGWVDIGQLTSTGNGTVQVYRSTAHSARREVPDQPARRRCIVAECDAAVGGERKAQSPSSRSIASLSCCASGLVTRRGCGIVTSKLA